MLRVDSDRRVAHALVAVAGAWPCGGALGDAQLRELMDRRDDLDQIYELVFADSAVPMAVVTLDGKFLRTNVRFEAASGYGRTELERITVFNLTAPAHLHVTFSFMSLVLRGPAPASHLGTSWRLCRQSLSAPSMSIFR